ncbi:hypothetical protein M0412_20115 [Agrobacterium sp. O3.4]|uniref:Uncharacterized protein n=2 Tax=Rhizobium/Agrobacterium group TaxID=227290 RepID=A0A546XCN7_RHIRH|nr:MULTISPECIES: POTRA domain-containing protein [Rhizobium/Agrobacterium group]MCZ7471009.1 hypothetical protein [Rhizobium rhizogenes]TRA98481.1 hypothetical protein EXN68_20455 [Rhizobium rhizogenes]WHO10766.1 hypothetical protein KZ699_19980 [Agrobacterium cucumeris]
MIKITGYEPFGKKLYGFETLRGASVAATDIAVALNRINAFYRAAGFITTDADLP